LVGGDIIHSSTECGKMYLNWLRASCMVSITTVVTWHTPKTNFWGWLWTTCYW